MGVEIDRVSEFVIVSFDLFGTLVDATPPTDPAAAVASELAARDIPVPETWMDAYCESHIAIPDGAECSLSAHVVAALESRGVEPDESVVQRAVVAAFEPTDLSTRSGAEAAVTAAATHGPVAVLSNCSVPGLGRRALRRSTLDSEIFDAVVTSVACGWRKPDRRAFTTVAERFDASLTDLVHIGDDPRTDGGADDAGATSILLTETPLEAVPNRLEEVARP